MEDNGMGKRMKITPWNSDKAKQEVPRRFKQASYARAPWERKWSSSERAVYQIQGNASQSLLDFNFNSNEAPFSSIADVDNTTFDMNIAYTFKNFRFIHAQMAANPPSVLMRPNSSDLEDRRRADAADRVMRWALRKYSMQEKFDQLSLQTLLRGTGVIKTIWDPTLGDIIAYDKETDEIELEGDFKITVPNMWNVFIDPDANTWEEVKFVIERIYIDYDEACMRWPDRVEALKKARLKEGDTGGKNALSAGQQGGQAKNYYNIVELLEYWETGLATNGYLGRYCVTTPAGDVIENPRPSPFRFVKSGTISTIEDNENMSDDEKSAAIAALPEMASLPYTVLTDIDVPNSVYGKSFIEYAAPLQDLLNRVDTGYIDNISAHGMARLVVPDDSEVTQMSDSTTEVIKVSGNRDPHYLEVPTLMPDMAATRQNIILGINEVSGVNEAMFGQQSREMSGASMQYATNQDNLIRRRVFNKYVNAVEKVYTNILSLVRKHWTVKRTVRVLGKENALEAIDIKGTDIDGGYDVVGEYGTAFSLDPIARKEEILMMQPNLEKAGISPRRIMSMLKLAELDGIYDEFQLAENRQREIFEEIIATNTYIPPEEFMQHEYMIEYAYKYFMSSEFKYLAPNLKELCKQHIRDRIKLAAMEKSGQLGPTPEQALPPEAPGPMPEGVTELPPPVVQAPIQNT